jgi:hypothetical protein
MDSLKPTKTVYSASQFLDWQRSGTLQLNPIFQRRPVWKPAARSQLIDSIVRGYPIPIILLRQVQDLSTLKVRMEVVDGQQRLRTLIAYLDPNAIAQYNEDTDGVVVRRSHNPAVAGKSFSVLSPELKQAILGYEFSTHVLQASTSDALVFRIFALLNSTGLSLNPQEVRNAEFHGAFKALAYDLSFQFLDYWRRWDVFSNDKIARMEEAEAVSEYLIAMIEGLSGKTQAKITRYYKLNDEVLPHADILTERFTRLMAALDKGLGELIADSVFQRPALFYSLFVALYDHAYGLGSQLKAQAMKPLPHRLAFAFQQVDSLIDLKDLDADVQDAMDRATSDTARRRIRHDFLLKELGLDSVA